MVDNKRSGSLCVLANVGGRGEEGERGGGRQGGLPRTQGDPELEQVKKLNNKKTLIVYRHNPELSNFSSLCVLVGGWGVGWWGGGRGGRGGFEAIQN